MKYRFADCVLDTERHVLERGGAAQPVEPQVFDLLRLLADAAGRMVSRDEMVEAVWQGRIVSDSAISARIAAARKAVGDDGKAQRIIRTVARRGLEMVAKVTVEAAPEAPASAPARHPDPAPRSGEIPRVRYTRGPRGKAIAYSVAGEGPALIRMPHTFSHIEAEWGLETKRALFQRLATHNRFATFDPVGVGLSDRDVDEVDWDAGAEDLMAVADAAGMDEFALLSESGGMFVALRVAARWPERVRRLILVGAYVEGRGIRPGAPESEPLRAMLQAGWADPEGSFAMALMAAYFPDSSTDTLRDLARALQMSVGLEHMLQLRDAANAGSVAHLLPDIRCPTLLIHGRGDTIHPVEQARKLAAGIAGAELVLLETKNDLPWIDAPGWDRYVDAVLTFLSE